MTRNPSYKWHVVTYYCETHLLLVITGHLRVFACVNLSFCLSTKLS